MARRKLAVVLLALGGLVVLACLLAGRRERPGDPPERWRSEGAI